MSKQGYSEAVAKVAADVRKESFVQAPKTAWKAVKTLIRFKGKSKWNPNRCIPKLLKQDGTYTVGKHEVAEEYLEHFARAEQASIISYAELQAKYNDTSTLQIDRLSADNVQGITHLQAQYASVKGGKAVGTAGISNDLLRAAPQQMARLFHPLITKNESQKARAAGPQNHQSISTA